MIGRRHPLEPIDEHLRPLIVRTLGFFDEQRKINRVFWEGGQPLRLVDDLDAVLTHTSLRTLPLWMLGTDDVKQNIAMSSRNDAAAVEYARGARALAEHDYTGAAVAFTDAEQRGLRNAAVRALRAYALCRSGRVDEAAALAPDSGTRQSPDEAHFWKWLREEFQMSG